MTFLTKQMHLERQSETVPSEQLGSAGDASKCREAGRREPGPSRTSFWGPRGETSWEG